MSVPVRYSAAANYAVVESGLSNTLQEEEQYHQYQQQQQQQQQHQQQLYCQFVANANVNVNANANIIHSNNNNNSLGLGECSNYVNGFEVQQQLMQQRSSIASSVSPTTGLPANSNINISNHHRNIVINNNQISASNMDNLNINNINVLQEKEDHLHNMHHASQYQQQQQHFDNHLAMSAEMSTCEQSELSSSSGVSLGGGVVTVAEGTNSAMLGASTSATAAVAAANGSGSAEMHAVDVDVDEWRMSDEGRYGTPGAAGLEYQKYELEQQQQQQESPANMMNQPMESSLMDNENRNMKKNTNDNMKNNNKKNNTVNSDANNSTDSPNSTKKENELIGLSSEELYRMLNEYNVLQDKYHTILLLPRESKREVTAGGRDGSAYVLRCLKMWYELPSDVLFLAMSLVDRFLDRMAVKPKHMACMSVASFYLAIKQQGLKPIPADELATISQVNLSKCGCTAGDLERMADVIANKLGVQMGTTPVTAVTILRVFYALFRNLAKSICEEFYEFYLRMIKLEDLENRLENLLCDVKTTVVTPSTLALILMCLHLDFHIKASYKRHRPELKPVFEFILSLQEYLGIPDQVFTCGFTIVSDILSHYNGQNKQPYKQRLVWKLSSRTLKVLRPTNRFSTDLPTIDEGQTIAMDEGCCRSRTESISSEEEEDWPTSPIIPIFEQC
ncbi:cyclin G isoform X1 [Anastrepha obliqua]|uniref:cyclin G isoform X1 n=1 Tax=Anastrepha obliqua TaxID=95512 RepID=UPI00240A5A08|nr:cyclin G isoform X1 [Anastrepha obliqua]XP_054744930.1 cyclin G isoform X1 [Anastrepha obliqua]